MNKKKAKTPQYISTVHFIFILMFSAIYGNDCFLQRQFSFWPDESKNPCMFKSANLFRTSKDSTALALAWFLQAVG